MRQVILGFLGALLVSGAASAAPSGDLAVYAGQFGVFSDSNEKSVNMGVEYRYRDVWHGLRPTVGAMTNTDGALYGYAGINWDIALGSKFYLTPGVKVGGYSQGSSKDLGYGIEFHDSIELTYRMQSGQRIGASLVHMSNASLGNKNPGVEMIQAVYSHPF